VSSSIIYLQATDNRDFQPWQQPQQPICQGHLSHTVHYRFLIWKLNAINLPYGKKDGRYFWPCPPSIKYSTPPHAPHTRQTSSNRAYIAGHTFGGD
jgi:hypothetical protein